MKKNYLSLLRNISDQGGDYVIVGGLALILLGHNRVTFDVDIVPSLVPESWSTMIDIIERLGGSSRIPEPMSEIANVNNIKNWIEEKNVRAITFRSPDKLVELDLLVSESDDYEQFKARSIKITVEEHTYNVASVDDLIRMKEAAGRDKDLEDLEFLYRLKAQLES